MSLACVVVFNCDAGRQVKTTLYGGGVTSSK